MTRQISILLENKVGAIYEVTDTLAEANINIKAFSVFDTPSFGILRLLVDEYEKAEKVLKENGFGFKVNKVLAVEIDHKVGALNEVIKILKDEGHNINYVYSMVIRDSKPLMIMDVDDREGAIKTLKEKGMIVDDME